MIDFAVVSVGMRSDLAVFSDSGIKIENNGIVVHEQMKTNIEGVWAAVDCPQCYSGIDGDVIGGEKIKVKLIFRKDNQQIVGGRS